MTGKPAARQGDMTAIGGPIVQGSAGVFIGAPTGVACSVCPGGITYGSPVNPLLGAKVLPGETDVALPGPLPFVLSRSYSSYQTKTPAPVGIFGPGWYAPSDIHLQIRDGEIVLNDSGGRSIHFDPLFPGETAFSRSESLWLARCGTLKLHESNVLHRLWQALPESIRLSPHMYLATSSPQGPWWLLGWADRVPGVDEALPAPLPSHRILTGLVDGFGHALTFHREARGDFTGYITAVTDGAGRRFRLELARISGVPQTHYGADEGVRLAALWLTHDPEYPDKLPPVALVRYEYSSRGELAAVYDRGDAQVRCFDYDPQHPGRMVAHQYAGRPKTVYRYDAAGRVVEQHNPADLSYTYRYEKNTVTITDNLNRHEVLHTEGERGMKRVIKKDLADGSSTHSEFDPAGRLIAQTDAAGRKTQYRLSPGSGLLTEIVTPDGRSQQFNYNGQHLLIIATGADGLSSRKEYDDLGRLAAETSRRGDVTRYFYADSQSEYPSATEAPSGSRKHMTWSRYGQLLTFTDCSGYETRYEYNRFGQITAIHQEEDLSHYWAYDSRGRLVSRKDTPGLETRYEYSVAGDLTTVVSPDGSRRETQYDAGGRPISITEGGLTRKMKYDAAGRITTLVNENNATTTFSWDPMDRLVAERGFDGRIRHYHYSVSGHLIRSEDEGLVTLWHYDASDRLTHRTVNDEEAERWQYNEYGWLKDISHHSNGHRVTVHYDYDETGRMTRERQTVHTPDAGELQWEHTTAYEYRNSLVYRTTSDHLPPVEWLTYGSGYLAGMKFGNEPLIDFIRDRLHRETLRSFGTYELASAYTASGQLQDHTLSLSAFNREYIYNNSGELVHIHAPLQQRHYQYDAAGRLNQEYQTHTKTTKEYFTDPAGNRIAGQQQYPALPARFPDNRLSEDVNWFYHHDAHGRLTEKDERRVRDGGSHTHHYSYDSQHRLIHYVRTQQGQPLEESRYLYDPLGRRIAAKTMQGTTWYGWDGDRLTTAQTDNHRVQTVYLPGSFTPLLRIETSMEELKKAAHRSLAEKLQQDAGMTFMSELVTMLDDLEQELRLGKISEANRQWLAQCGLTPAQMENQMEPVYTPLRKIHLYHCDHRGLPLALIQTDGGIAWSAEYDEWGNMLREDNPDDLEQLIRLPGQQYDKETGLHYNRHRYYDPTQGRYITQDPIGLRGGWNPYTYPLNPIQFVDPLGLAQVCSRPLKGSRGIRTNGMTGLDLGVFHAHIFFDDGTNIGFGGDSGLFSEPKTNDYTCNKEKYNDDIMKKAVEIVKNEPDNLLFPEGSKQYGNDNYNFIVNNCQDFVSDVLDEYKKLEGAKQ
ncbi:RHS repeat-associated core domain-containing protein [Trabulsiella odontotermitis]|uniref:RHS repeat-associated core domain-containing protein n=1 Tax=Trabulsiella odontotermitis TaxID=379893 RepID=UPI0024B74CFB|nr:RHS repeat-associated core domain-containing protein [Trabulsiella odontotermitis]WHP30888.1 RHS repeat-associated core domain-containing protein [Trabulsiella odontotermitis]